MGATISCQPWENDLEPITRVAVLPVQCWVPPMLPGVLPMAVTQEPVRAAGGAPEAEAVAASVVGPDTPWQAVTCGSTIPYESSIATAADEHLWGYGPWGRWTRCTCSSVFEGDTRVLWTDWNQHRSELGLDQARHVDPFLDDGRMVTLGKLIVAVCIIIAGMVVVAIIHIVNAIAVNGCRDMGSHA